jgi:hypothetical protein
VEVFGRVGYRDGGRPDELSVRLESPTGKRPLLLRLARQGRIFGGTYALEITTAEPVLPASRGLSARGRGVVRMSGVSFRARGGDPDGRILAGRLAADRELGGKLREVHFERLSVDPDGRPVIRHMGGSLVWILFPPLVKAVPLVEAQARASVAALDAFARAGGS